MMPRVDSTAKSPRATLGQAIRIRTEELQPYLRLLVFAFALVFVAFAFVALPLVELRFDAFRLEPAAFRVAIANNVSTIVEHLKRGATVKNAMATNVNGGRCASCHRQTVLATDRNATTPFAVCSSCEQQGFSISSDGTSLVQLSFVRTLIDHDRADYREADSEDATVDVS